MVFEYSLKFLSYTNTKYECTVIKKVMCNAIFNLKIISRANSSIPNNNIRSIILEIKNDRCKIIKILIFRSLSGEHFK